MLKLKAYAKLDLAIDIFPKKLSSGFFPVHYIDTQMDLSDELTFESLREEIRVVCKNPELSPERENFVYKTAVALRKIVGREDLGAKINLLKNIPIRAGFGGGSSDGAATVLGLSELWKVKVSQKQIRNLSRDLGKDFFYSIYGGLSEVLGKGNDYKVTPIKSKLPDFWLLLAVPKSTKPSTGWVYENLKKSDLGRNSAKIKKLKTALLKRDKMGICENLTNDFEPFVSSKFPVVSDLKEVLLRAGALATIMAGAGLSVVGFFESKEATEIVRTGLLSMKSVRQILISRIKN